MIRGVCFDMDGVLLDTETLGGVVMREAAALQDCPLTLNQWHSLLGQNMAWLLKMREKGLADAPAPQPKIMTNFIR